MKKKILTLLTVFCLTLSLLPVNALAVQVKADDIVMALMRNTIVRTYFSSRDGMGLDSTGVNFGQKVRAAVAEELGIPTTDFDFRIYRQGDIYGVYLSEGLSGMQTGDTAQVTGFVYTNGEIVNRGREQMVTVNVSYMQDGEGNEFAYEVLVHSEYDWTLLEEKSGDTSLVSASVFEVPGTIEEQMIYFTLTYGMRLPEDWAEFTITPADTGATVQGPEKLEEDGKWSFQVVAENGDTQQYTIQVTIATNPAAENKELLTNVKATIEAQDWSVLQGKANDAEAIKAWVEEILAGLGFEGVDMSVTITNCLSAGDGTDGTYAFTVSLAKGEGLLLAEDTAIITNAVIKASPVTPPKPEGGNQPVGPTTPPEQGEGDKPGVGPVDPPESGDKDRPGTGSGEQPGSGDGDKPNPPASGGGNETGSVPTPPTIPDDGYDDDASDSDEESSWQRPAAPDEVEIEDEPVILADANPFTDVSLEDPFYQAVIEAYYEGLISGTGESTFSPNAAVPRGTVADVVWKKAGAPQPKVAANFTDLSDTVNKVAIEWCNEYGVMIGYGDGTFGPEAPITREQLAAVLYRFADYLDMDTSVAEETNFDDAAASNYAAPAIRWVIQQNIMKTTSTGTFNPTGTVTRAELVLIIAQLEKIAT